MKTYHIANCSHGKDSQAMVRGLLQKGWPLDEVVFYDTGAEFQAIYSARDHLLPLTGSPRRQIHRAPPRASVFLRYVRKTRVLGKEWPPLRIRLVRGRDKMGYLSKNRCDGQVRSCD